MFVRLAVSTSEQVIVLNFHPLPEKVNNVWGPQTMLLPNNDLNATICTQTVAFYVTEAQFIQTKTSLPRVYSDELDCDLKL